jgi:hypothetical protein
MLEIKCFGVKLIQAMLYMKKAQKHIVSLLLGKANFKKLLAAKVRKKSNKWMVSAFHIFVGFGEIAMLYKTQRNSTVKAL